MNRPWGILLSVLLLTRAAVAFESTSFQSAKPIWPEGREEEKNLTVGFRAVFEASAGESVRVQVTGRTVYRLYCNGEFAGYGPARGPHGYDRVDVWDITSQLRNGTNLIAVEVAGYNVNSYYLLDQPSYLQAEVSRAGEVLASTGGEGFFFEALILDERVQKAQRYSFQRPFSEIYRLGPDFNAWRVTADASIKPVSCSEQETQPLLPRRVPYPRFRMRQPVWSVSEGRLETEREVKRPWKDRSLTQIGPELGGYPETELAEIPTLYLQEVGNLEERTVQQPLTGPVEFTLQESAFQLLDFGTNLTGFIGATVRCSQPTQLVFTFDEILRNGDVDFKRMGTVNAIVYYLEPGEYKLESFEPYTLRYLKCMTLEGECRVQRVTLREYVNPDVWEAHFVASDERLNRLFSAGRETFRQNALDVFMDCPSRERAGWLCDSFFTARVAKVLSGDTRLEKNFFENYLLPERFAHLPEGMLPMCYPADHNDGVFIPNWALWFVLQLEEYLERSGDRELVDALEPKVKSLFEYFARFRNEDGLLEKLESWVFVEWSKAADFTQDVNYPSNMLYAEALDAAGRMYRRRELQQEAEAVRNTVREQAFDGEFFVDNAQRSDGCLTVTRNRTEVCQYFAFFFGVATPETHPKLWRRLTEEFGPERSESGRYPDIHQANAFIGNVLRLEILSRNGRNRQLLSEVVDYLLYMAERTATLWENQGDYASCNHGFASHIVHTLYRDALGLHRIDTVNRRVRLRFTDVDMDWCEGRVPCDDGYVSLQWRKKGDTIVYRCDLPANYTLRVENSSGASLVREP